MGDETKTLTELQRAQGAPAPSGPLESAAGTSAGIHLGRYVLLYRVGSGGMGVVYAAYDPELDRKVAVKVLRRQPRHGRAEEMARLEAQAMAKLTHPNVVTVHDVGTHDGGIFIAMEFVSGRTLKAWLLEERPPWDRIVEIFVQAGQGLAAAHQAGLVHRDFKPSNVMLSDDGAVKVLDFGLARQQPTEAPQPSESAPEGPSARPIAVPKLVGTLAYLPPERLQGHVDDPSSDQFSFCAALWQALYGVLPFPAENLVQYGLRVQKEPTPDEASASNVPHWLRQALLRGLRFEPSQRFGSISDLLDAISPPRRKPWWQRWQGIAAGLLFALGVVALWQGRLSSPCGDATARLEGIWDTPGAQTIQKAFLDSGLSFAETAWQSTFRLLDAQATEWTEQYTEACEATHVRGEQSATRLDERMACLDQHLERFRSLSQTLQQADVSTVIGAVEVVGQLPSPTVCGRQGPAIGLPPLPRDEAARRHLEAIGATLETQLTRQRFHQPVDLDAVRQAVQQARSAAYPPLHARALFVLGWLESQSSMRRSGVEHLIHGAQVALAIGDIPRTVDIFTALAKVESTPPANLGQASVWLGFAQAQLAVLPRSAPELQLEISDAAGWVALPCQPRDAADHWGQALGLSEGLDEGAGLRTASILANLSLLETPEKESYLRRALEVLESWYGPEHPILAQHLSNLAAFEAGRGRYDEAMSLARRALTVVSGDLPQNVVAEGAYPLTLLGQLHLAVDDPSTARQYLLQARERVAPASHVDTLPLRISLALGDAALLAQNEGDLAASLQESTQRLAASRERYGPFQGCPPPADVDAIPWHSTRQQSQSEEPLELRLPAWMLLRQQAQLHLLQRRPDEAWTLLEAPLAELEDATLPPTLRADLLLDAAESLLSLGDPQGAYPFTRRALLGIDETHHPRRAARGHLAAARCLWNNHPLASKRRAEKALDLLKGDQEPLRRLRDRITDWQAAVGADG